MGLSKHLLKYSIGGMGLFIMIVLIGSWVLSGRHANNVTVSPNHTTQNIASNDSAAESLDTLTAELASTQQEVNQITTANAQLTQQNKQLLNKINGTEDATTTALSQQLNVLKAQVSAMTTQPTDTPDHASSGPQAITTVTDLTSGPNAKEITNPLGLFNTNNLSPTTTTSSTAEKPKPIPYFTIPANATAVDDRLMSALVGRIPIKGVVTDPYPFKIVFSNDTLAANGLRVPDLKQMIVSGYAEGDLNLVSVRGWVTSLTFVFQDGRISTTTSNNNDIGHFTKDNALGYLSDPQGNPFIRGKLITNAPEFLTGTVALGAAQGAASAYAQSQTTSQTSLLGSLTSTVTGSPGKYIAGQAAVNAASTAQQWWSDREGQSFDAIYVAPGQEIVVNFAKEIEIDYDPLGRKLTYANSNHSNNNVDLD